MTAKAEIRNQRSEERPSQPFEEFCALYRRHHLADDATLSELYAAGFRAYEHEYKLDADGNFVKRKP
jgi:hypothetical protein